MSRWKLGRSSFLRSCHCFRAASTQGGVSFVGAHVRQVAPAALAFIMVANSDVCGEAFASGKVEITKDKELGKSGVILPDGVIKAVSGQGKVNGGFEV